MFEGVVDPKKDKDREPPKRLSICLSSLQVGARAFSIFPHLNVYTRTREAEVRSHRRLEDREDDLPPPAVDPGAEQRRGGASSPRLRLRTGTLPPGHTYGRRHRLQGAWVINSLDKGKIGFLRHVNKQ